MRSLWGIAFGVVGGLLGAGLVLLIARPPRGEPVQLLPPPTPAPLRVHVAGAVAHPGVHALPDGSRAEDALAAAGGLLPAADPQSINLAAFLQDGERLVIPTLPPTPDPRQPTLPPQARGQPAAIPAASSSPTFPLDLNLASAAELEALPGIGPVTAEKIVAYRQEHGPFKKIEAIEEVSGIGPATFEKIQALIVVK